MRLRRSRIKHIVIIGLALAGIAVAVPIASAQPIHDLATDQVRNLAGPAYKKAARPPAADSVLVRFAPGATRSARERALRDLGAATTDSVMTTGYVARARRVDRPERACH